MYSGKCIAALTAVLSLAPVAPTDAGTIDKTVLGANRWFNNNATQAGEIACNYIYTDYRDRLLYYGTSQNCRDRLDDHANDIKHQLNFLAQVEDLAHANLRAALWEWSSTVQKDERPYEGRGTSDMCLATNQKAAGSSASIWYIALPNTVTAKAVEKCVLGDTVGYCNRKGRGTVKKSGQEFINAVNGCVAKAEAESKQK